MQMNAERPEHNPGDAPPDIIIEGGILLTMVEGDPPRKNAWVCIKGDRITDIIPAGTRPGRAATDVIKADRCIVMPGLCCIFRRRE